MTIPTIHPDSQIGQLTSQLERARQAATETAQQIERYTGERDALTAWLDAADDSTDLTAYAHQQRGRMVLSVSLAHLGCMGLAFHRQAG